MTFDKPDARTRLAGERVHFGHHPTTRNLPNLVRNVGLAWSVLRRERPDVIVSDGAGLAVPFFWLVDPEARMVEAFVLGSEGYTLAIRASGPNPVSPPPFSDLALVPASLWP